LKVKKRYKKFAENKRNFLILKDFEEKHVLYNDDRIYKIKDVTLKKENNLKI
jgi:hypothetical protein